MIKTLNLPDMITEEKLKDLYKQMWLIRYFDEKVDQFFAKGLIHGTTHLCVGQEASAAGSIAVIGTKDKIVSTHRGHGHCIAKEGDVNKMMAELFGRETGYCKGKGGSMHIADVEKGNLGANGIVGGGLPLAVGAALTSKMKKKIMLSFASLAMVLLTKEASMNRSTLQRFGIYRLCLFVKITSTGCLVR